MNTVLFVQTIMAFVMGMASLLLVYRILNGYLNRRYQLSEHQNAAYGIFQTGIILATSLMLTTIVDPAVNAFRLFSQAGITAYEGILVIFYVMMFVIIGVIVTLLLIAAATLLLFSFSKIDEWAEIKNNNVGVALISAAVVVGLALVMGENVGHLCEAILPYPQTMFIR